MKAEIAKAIAKKVIGLEPSWMRRFGKGSQHFVFEAGFEDREPIVVRIADERGRKAMAGGSVLSRRLRPLGVPLPRVLSEDLVGPYPYMALERLPGSDLGDVIGPLSDSAVDLIAAHVVRAQAATAGTESAGRYGYAVSPRDAPRRRWSEVLQDNLARSRQRIRAAGLFDCAAVDAVGKRVADATDELAAIEAIPFLHDTTTKNVIVNAQGEFSGIVDVDDLCFGDPRYPAALTLASLTASRLPTRYVDAWLQAAGFQDDRIFRLYAALFVVDFMSEHGQIFNGNEIASTGQGRDRLLAVFAEFHRRASS